jgi:glycosyltransferase involved in cell wall biosynthesis
LISLSVVMPVFNEASYLPETIESLCVALENSGFDAELVLVDDGSTDGSADVAIRAVAERVRLRVVRQRNRGRIEARRAGLEAAANEFVLLLDGRVRLDAHSLSYVSAHISGGLDVWTGHVDIDAGGNPYAIFWKLIADLAWSDYFDQPRETNFGVADFDRFPKGTGCFLAPRQLLLDAIGAFRSRYADLRHANDDTPLLRWIARRRPISIAPSFRATYRPRLTFPAFLRHSFHRGLVFLDGHGRRESRFFPAVVAFYPASVLLGITAVRKPSVLPSALVCASIVTAAFGVKRGRNRHEVATLALLTPAYALAHGAGMWRGLLADAKLRRRS